MKKQEVDSLPLTAAYFKLLLEDLYAKFKENHKLNELPKSMQFFGYGNYNVEKPNLKSDLEQIGSDFINGKYLYDKVRDYHKGKPVIKLNRYYKAIVLLYLGYESIDQFLNKNTLGDVPEKKQLDLLYDATANQTYYYVNYYFGEENLILKGETVISNNWKKVKHTYVYPKEDGSIETHYNFGNIIRREDTLHINSKTLLDGKLVEGASEIYYVGHNDLASLKFLIGTYCTFDNYTNTVAGEAIWEKCASKEDMEERVKDPRIPPYIAMEVRNKRIVNKSIVPTQFLEISNHSPYASIYESLTGTYEFNFMIDGVGVEQLKFKIAPNNYKMIPLTENVYFENDSLKLLNKGSVVHFSFDFTGIIAFDQVQIYFKTYFLKPNSEIQNGTFSGIDNENRLVNGEVRIQFKANVY